MSVTYQPQIDEEETSIYRNNRQTEELTFEGVNKSDKGSSRKCCGGWTSWKVATVALATLAIASVLLVIILTQLTMHSSLHHHHKRPTHVNNRHGHHKATTQGHHHNHHASPHIIFVLADDLGYNDVGYQGSEIKTPHIDLLSLGGVRLNNYYVQQLCTPSRSQLLSGRYQIHTGLQHGTIHPPAPYGLPLSDITLSHTLHAAGYNTHFIGKWHLGFYKEEYMPHRRGFDTTFGFSIGKESYYNHTNCFKDYGCGFDFRRQKEIARNTTGRYSTYLFAEEAVDLIEKNDNKKPMFMYLSMQSPHYPLQAPEEYLRQYQHIKDENRRTYAAMVTCMDDALKNVTTALKNNNIYHNSIIIFSTDNGGTVTYGGSNWPLRGQKDTLWEGGIRGVGFVHSPLLKHPGVENNELIHISDWYPTLANLAKAKTKGLPLDGFDVWKTISKGHSSPRVELLHNIDPLNVSLGLERYPHDYDTRVQSAIRHGKWKLLTGNPGDKRHHSVPAVNITVEETVPSTNQSVYLFDILRDPRETVDLSTSRPDVVNFLLDRLMHYNETAVPCVYPKFDQKASPAYHNGTWGPWM